MDRTPVYVSRLSWVTLAWNLIVILWGAVVRATGSGAGCGSHWPLCDGQVVPQSPGAATLIELTHRLTTGLALILVVAMVVAVFRNFPKGHRARYAATATLILILVEAAIGAGLVLFELVADDISGLRAIYMAAHLMNTLFLMAALTLTARWTSDSPTVILARNLRRFRQGLVLACLLTLLATGASGAISALGDTLFPAQSLQAGFEQDLAGSSHFLIRLRAFHPLIAIGAALCLLILCRRELESASRSPTSTRFAQALMAAVLVQTGIGVLNIALLAPIWMQIVHLTMANGVWILFILLVDARPEHLS